MQAEPKTRRGRQTRDLIVECAAELIAQHGAAHLGVNDVLAAAGASKSQLYHYFADRDALVEAAVARRCDRVQDALARLFAGMDSLLDLERRLDDFAARYEQSLAGCPIGRIASEVGGRHEGAQRQAQLALARWQELFTSLFTRLRERGDLRPDSDPATLATALLAALEGGQLLSQTARDAASLRVAIAAALGYARTFAT